MTRCLFATDLHGDVARYDALFRQVETLRPDAVCLGGDLLPGPALPAGTGSAHAEFIGGFLATRLERLRQRLGEVYPRIFVILGNDDDRVFESSVLDVAARGLWEYAHGRCLQLGDFTVHGYAYVPPTPFALKDWERYDVSRYVDPGCVSPEEGRRTVPISEHEARYSTIQQDLDRLEAEMDRAVFLFHAPPYRTVLDRAALDGRKIDYAPVDVHVGSIAIRRFIESRQPLLTLHGHVHEAARLSGAWRERLGKTWIFGGAHDGPELALVSFDLDDLPGARRRLLKATR